MPSRQPPIHAMSPVQSQWRPRTTQVPQRVRRTPVLQSPPQSAKGASRTSPPASSRGARMWRSAGKGDRRGTHRGRRRLRPRHRPGTDAFHRSDGAPKARAELLPGLKAARLQPTSSPNRSPSPARQPALAPGLSLVSHGCGDPLIRLVQEPQLNRVLEGWCSGCTRKKPPRAFERPGARAGCRAGPGDRSSKSPPASRARVFPKRGLARL
jgi:hypothetical protein